jgi:hypothetical protein
MPPRTHPRNWTDDDFRALRDDDLPTLPDNHTAWLAKHLVISGYWSTGRPGEWTWALNPDPDDRPEPVHTNPNDDPPY